MRKVTETKMVEQTITKFIADDGQEFDSEHHCRAYERRLKHEQALKELEKIETCEELRGSPNFDGAEYMECHSYLWYRPKNHDEIEVLSDVFGDEFDYDMIGEWICVEVDDYDGLWVTCLNSGIRYVQAVLSHLGYEMTVTKREDSSISEGK